MQYYTFTRTYQVRAQNFKAAQIEFSRALENREEDQYYVGTRYGFPTTGRTKSVRSQLLTLIPWFLDEARNQIFGYPKYQQ